MGKEYWFYIMYQNSYNEFIEYTNKHKLIATFPMKTQIKSGDRAYIIIKNAKTINIMGCFQIETSAKKNKTFEIFSNKNSNLYFVDISCLCIMQKPLTLSNALNIMLKINTSKKEFNSIRSFKSKYINNETLGFVRINHNAIYLYDHIISSDIIDIDNTYIQDLKSYNQIKPNIKKIIKCKSNNLNLLSVIDPNNGIILPKTINNNYSNSSSNSSSNYCPNFSSNSNSSTSYVANVSEEHEPPNDVHDVSNISTETSSEDENGRIPILVIPCDRLKKRMKYSLKISKHILNHYKFCDECEITNNNRKELSSISDNAEIDTVKIDESTDSANDDVDIHNVIDKYWKSKKHMPKHVLIDSSRDILSPYIRIILIGNFHDFYYGSIIIEWF
jgi:hypothetical protein